MRELSSAIFFFFFFLPVNVRVRSQSHGYISCILDSLSWCLEVVRPEHRRSSSAAAVDRQPQSQRFPTIPQIHQRSKPEGQHQPIIVIGWPVLRVLSGNHIKLVELRWDRRAKGPFCLSCCLPCWKERRHDDSSLVSSRTPEVQ